MTTVTNGGKAMNLTIEFTRNRQFRAPIETVVTYGKSRTTLQLRLNI